MQNSYKSSSFLKTIERYARRQKAKAIDEIRRLETQALEKAEASLTEDTNNMIQRELVTMRNKIAVEISHKELAERRKISLRRQEIMAEIYENCKNKLISFTKTKEYEEKIKLYAEKIFPVLKDKKAKIFVKKEDLKFSEVMKAAFDSEECEILADETIFIGGLRGVSEKNNIIADETLDEKLFHEKEWAAENLGVQLI